MAATLGVGLIFAADGSPADTVVRVAALAMAGALAALVSAARSAVGRCC